MAYTVLARKYRPQKFADLVGQEHVTRTIGNAIASGRVAHAFLFTGARGVGKTSTARLLAKALNCETGPTPEPCNVCDACLEITQGNDLDVLEIDGASHNSVDDVRKLQEGLPYRPARDRFKVVIVDEVHMLSTGAFNAFLKTLEEPPPHVKFIFATTEVHKVPITIRSRCQRHDFRLIPQVVVVEHVRQILAAENVDFDEAALHLVAREAAGSMRDALTTLDQVLAFSGETLTGESVAKALGIAGREQVFAAAKALIEGDPARCLRAVSALGEAGVDVLHFSRQLVEYLRDLVVLRVVGPENELVELSPDERAAASELCRAQDGAELQRAFAGVSALVDTVAQSAHPRMALEMGLVRLADRPRLQPLAELVARLDQALAGGSAGPPPGRGEGGGGGRPASGRGPDPRFQPPGGERSAAPTSAAAGSRPSNPPDTAAREATPSMADPRFQPPSQGHRASAPPAQATAPEKPAEQPATPPTQATAPEKPAAQPATSALSAPPRGGAGPDPSWTQIVTRVRERLPALGAILEHGIASELSPERMVLRFPEGSFFGRQAKTPAAQQALAEAAEHVLGARPKLEVEFGAANGHATIAQVETEARTARVAQVRQEALNHPAVLDAMEIFPETKGNADVQVDVE